MPRMNGIEFVKQLRKHIASVNQTSSVQVVEPNIVFLTAYLTMQFKKQLEELKITAHYDKPVELSTLSYILLDSQKVIINRELGCGDEEEDLEALEF